MLYASVVVTPGIQGGGRVDMDVDACAARRVRGVRAHEGALSARWWSREHGGGAGTCALGAFQTRWRQGGPNVLGGLTCLPGPGFVGTVWDA